MDVDTVVLRPDLAALPEQRAGITVCFQTSVNLGFYSPLFKAINIWNQPSMENYHNT